MEGELQSLMSVWTIAVACICYCYYVSSRIPKGISRLISLLPIIYLFIILPLQLHSLHIGRLTFFFLTWLANFRLILFAFDQGPLYPPHPQLSHFICFACLPIRLKQEEPLFKPPQKPYPATNTLYRIFLKVYTPLSIVIKLLLLAIIMKSVEFRRFMPWYLVLALDCCLKYIELEFTLAVCALPARFLSGMEFEPQFNEPYLATSLQDFWGRRWNLMVTNILRLTVYNPVCRIATRVVGPGWATLPGVVAVFVASGLVHEAMYYYITRVAPTWEVTCFFVLHGACVVTEVMVKRAVAGKWRLHRGVSGALTLGFVAVTANWLFFPQMKRNRMNEKSIKELILLKEFVWSHIPLI